jgi:biotin synthase
MTTPTMDFGSPFHDGLPDKALRQEALRCYLDSATPEIAGSLFTSARQLRDHHLGQQPWWSAGISSITPCDLETLCTYCTFYTHKAAETAEIVAAARAIADLGIRHLHLSGGTRIPVEGVPDSGLDARIIEIVGAVRNALGSEFDIEVNVGPSLTRTGLRELKALGVSAVTSSLEVLNPSIFEKYKPGDSLSGRIQLMEWCEEEQLPIRSMMLVGLGESDEDRIDHLLFLRRFTMLRHLRLSRYLPFPGARAGGVRCSPWPVARLTAIARLLHPTLDLGLAAGNGPDDLALWWLAGGGNQVMGASVSMKDPRTKHDRESRSVSVAERIVLHDQMPQVSRYLGELGLSPGFHPPILRSQNQQA